ncbi:unnamed protein product [Effrenium voratum]|nr:unnamed protein product [Effrenium voratum]
MVPKQVPPRFASEALLRLLPAAREALLFCVMTCHGGMTQSFRSKSIKALKEGKAEILVATDIAARGLDVPAVTHVVNYELPLVLDEFVHRVGRTGRIGRSGTTVTLVTGREKIFGPMRRMLLSQGHELPEWMSLQGLQLAWRPRNYKIPFRKVKRGVPKDAAPDIREAYMIKNRDMQLRTKATLMDRMAELEGEPLSPKELNRGTFQPLVEEDGGGYDYEYDISDGNFQVTRGGLPNAALLDGGAGDEAYGDEEGEDVIEDARGQEMYAR